MRSLAVEDRIVLFKTLVISKRVFQALLTKIPYQMVKKLDKIRKKVKHETICEDYKGGSLKM